MPIAFEQVPNNILLPLFYAEVTNAPQPMESELRLCLIGNANRDTIQGPGVPGVSIGEGTAVLNEPYLLTGNRAQVLFGKGSMLHFMYMRARQNAPTAEIWGVAIPETPQTASFPAGSTRTIWTVTVTRAASSSLHGLAKLYLCGQELAVLIYPTDTQLVIRNKFIDACKKLTLPFRVTVGTGSGLYTQAILTSNWGGITTASPFMKFSNIGPRGKRTWDRATQLGYNFFQYVQTTAGTGENTPAAAYANLVDRDFDVFATFYPRDDATAFASQEFMWQRWHPKWQKYGHMFNAHPSDQLQTLIDHYTPQNDPHISVLAYKQSIIPPWEWSAALAAIANQHWAYPPELSRPLQTLQLQGMFVGDEDDETYNREEREALLKAGLSTFVVSPRGTCHIERVRTLYKWADIELENIDYSWSDAVTMFQAMYFVRAMRIAITSAFPRHALTNAPTNITGFTSPPQIRAMVLHTYKRLQRIGLVENFELFQQFLIVERDAYDANRVNILMRPDVANQLRVVATVVETHLELDASDPSLQEASASAA